MDLLGALRKEIDRFQNRAFLEAAMAVCALTGLAGGRVSFAQRYQVDTILATLDRLKIYDPHEAVDMLNGYVRQLREDRERAVAALVAKIRRHAGNDEAVRLLLRVAYLIITADGPIDRREGAMFDEICAILGNAPADVLADLPGTDG